MTDISGVSQSYGGEIVPDQPAAHSKRKRVYIAGALLGVLTVATVGGGTAWSYYYADRAMPGTTISGHDVSGMTRAEVLNFVTSHTTDRTINFQVAGQTVSAPESEFGVSFNVDETVNRALASSHSFSSQFKSLFTSTNVAPVVMLDEDKLKTFSEKLAQKAGPVVQQASVSADGQGDFVVTPAVVGKAVNKDKLKNDILAQAQALTSKDITAEVSDVQPTITDEAAQAVVADARALAAREVTVTDGYDNFSPEDKVKNTWVVIPQSADGTKLESPRYDKAKVTAWVEHTAKESNIEPVPTYNNVDASGKVLIEGAKPGRKGYSVNNAAKIIDGIVAAGEKGTDFSGTFEYDEVPAPVENRQVLPGAENMAYPAAEGEKWLEINLGTNSVSAYIGTDRVRGPIPIVPGAPGYETVTGLFHIYLKYEKQDMGCTPEWPYCAKDVPWVSYFHGSYAFHGAPWQSSFGWSGPDGSHGCVNMPVPEAQWVHQWSEMGTPVVSHY